MREFGCCVSSEGSADHEDVIADEVVESFQAQTGREAQTAQLHVGDNLTSQTSLSGPDREGILYTQMHTIGSTCKLEAVFKSRFQKIETDSVNGRVL